MHVFLDVSRLLLCVLRPSPAGIDRVEFAYARHWGEQGCTFVAQTAWGGLAALPAERVRRLMGHIARYWEAGPRADRAWDRARVEVARLHATLAAGMGVRRLRRLAAQSKGGVYLLVSHLSLENASQIETVRRMGLAFVPMVHDLIPTTHPEYARPKQVGRHHRRIINAATLADGVIVNSAATADSLLEHMPRSGQPLPPITVARLGLEARRAPHAFPRVEDPYFVTLGTIEPRKNHLLLLNLWRDLAERMGQDAPRLLVIGRRGWENENILDMLERCQSLYGLVQETGPLPDAEVTRLLAGARALLFPSFAEGYGLPLAESLALGTPAICSDLPALREVGGDVPDFLDPLDGAAWREAVLHYAEPGAPRREAQLARMAGWRVPGWAEHFAEVHRLLDQVVSRPAGERQPFPWGEPLQPAPRVEPAREPATQPG